MQTNTPFPLITHSPDGESRGLIFRSGDVFPLLPTQHILSAPATPATTARPWGLRFLVVPPITAGRHEGQTKVTSGGNPDGSNAEEIGTD